MITYHTDYPLGGKVFDGTMKPITLHAYDRNKYVLVQDNQGNKEWIKAGYIKKVSQPNAHLMQIRLSDLLKLPFQEGKTLSRLEIAKERRNIRQVQISHQLWIDLADGTQFNVSIRTHRATCKAIRKVLQCYGAYITRIEWIRKSSSKFSTQYQAMADITYFEESKASIVSKISIYKQLTKK